MIDPHNEGRLVATSFEDLLRAALPPHLTLGPHLSAGGQGAVWRGTCNGLDCAIKAYNTFTDTRRIDRECALLATLGCPNVVRIFEHFSIKVGVEPTRIVVYEYHDGGDIRSLLQPTAPQLTEKQLVAIGAEVGAGIEALWSHRIVHRDIKPANIVRAADGRHVLVDVGFARHLDLSDITAGGGSPGTRGYRSPEQALGRRSLTIKSDVFSLGVTLYCLALKQHPLNNQDPLTPVTIDTRPLDARSLSAAFVRLIGQMLDFTARKRPSDIAARFVTLGGP